MSSDTTPWPQSWWERGKRALNRLAREHSSHERLAVGAAVGVFVGCSPLFGLHTAIGVLLSRILGLNLFAVVLGTQVSLPFLAPFIVFASVQTGHLLVTGTWLNIPATRLNLDVASQFLVAWSIGSAAVGCLGGLATFALLRTVLSSIRREPNAVGQWTGRSRGHGLGYWLFFFVVRRLGRRFAYLTLHPVVFFYFVFDRAGRRESHRFFGQVVGHRSFWHRQKDIWLHFTALGRSLVDRLVMLGGKTDAFTLEEDGFDHLVRARAGGRGVLLLSGHFGSWALAGHLLQDELLPTLVVFDNEARTIRRFFERNPGRRAPKIIVFNESPTTSIEILRALRAGEVVAMLADRVAPGRPAFTVPFAGKNARVAAGPFHMAALAGAPIVMTFNYKTAPHRLRLSMQPPIDMRTVDRAGRESVARKAAERYAHELEGLARTYPHQWFNFFNFWA